jgi:hypothetical protein
MRAEGGVLLDKPGSDDDDAWNNLRVVLKISVSIRQNHITY